MKSMRSKLHYKNRYHLLKERDEIRNMRILNKIKRIYRRRFGEEIES